MAINYSTWAKTLATDDFVFLNEGQAFNALKYRDIKDDSEFHVFYSELICMDEEQTEELIERSAE